jgi:hypothetical protein
VPSLATTDLRGATVLESTSRGEAPATTRFGLGRRAHAPADGCLVAPVPDRRSPGRGTGVAGPARADDCRLARHRLPPAGGHRPADPRGQPRGRPPRTGSAPTRSWKTTEALRRLADPGRPVRLVRRMMHQAVGSCLQMVTTGDSRYGRTHWVYSRTHPPCRRCRTATRLRSAISGEPYQRDTGWCPRCQPQGSHAAPLSGQGLVSRCGSAAEG